MENNTTFEEKVKENKVEELLALEQKQSEMMKAAIEQSNALNMKRKEISSLYDKLNVLKSFPNSFSNQEPSIEQDVEQDVETDVTIVPFELQKNVSDSTLLPVSIELLNEYDEGDAEGEEQEIGQDELNELNQNLNRLKDQEQELHYLRQHLETLQNIKANLELQVACSPPAALDSTLESSLESTLESALESKDSYPFAKEEEIEKNEIPQDLMLQALLNRLMEASVKDIKDQEESKESIQLENETSDRLDQSILVNSSLKSLVTF